MMKYYFFDTGFTEKSENTKVVLGKALKSSTDVFWLDRHSYYSESGIPEWEKRVSILYPSVLYDGEKYRMWYHAWKTDDTDKGLVDKTNSQNVNIDNFKNTAKGTIYKGVHILCYMESDDGINFKRPALGEFFYKTKSGEIVDTNIVFVGSHGQGVCKNTHPEAGKGQSAFLLAGRCEDDENAGVIVAMSEDGIHWSAPTLLKKGDKSTKSIWADTHNQIFWSPEAMEYVIITRSFNGECREVTRVGQSGEASCVLSGKMNCQPYSVPVSRISEGYYVGIVSIADFDKNSPTFEKVHTRLVWSRDTKSFEYISSEPFIDNEKQFDFKIGNDFGMIYSSAPVDTGNEIKFFYAALPEPHYFSFDEIPGFIKEKMKLSMPKAYKEQSITRSTALKIASIKKDRFGGAYSENGEIVTKKFKVQEDFLLISADVNSGGGIEITSPELPGFCEMIFDNCTDFNILNTKEFYGREISFRFKITDATIYSITI